MSTSSSSTAIRGEIKSVLAKAGLSKINNDMLSKCIALATTLNITPKQMAECWEAYSLNRNVIQLDDHSFSGFRAELVKLSNVELPQTVIAAGGGAIVSKKRNLPNVTPPASNKRTNAHNNNDNAIDAAANRRVSLSPNLPKYSERTNAGKVVATYRPDTTATTTTLENTMTLSSEEPCATLISMDFDTNVRQSYRHMFTTLEERAKALDNHLVTLGQVMMDRYGLSYANNHDNDHDTINNNSEETASGPSATDMAALEAVGVPHQDAICCIGRICNAAHQGRINASSLVLEGARHISGGARVELDVSKLSSSNSSYSLFPGQIVAVEGMNTSGRKMVAQRLCEGAAHLPEKSTVAELMQFHHDDRWQGTRPLKIICAAGPYTASNNLEFEPLLDFMNMVVTEKPSVVILMGPFVDARHDMVASGQTTLQFENGEETFVPFEAFFSNKVSLLLEEFYSAHADIKTQFVLVPSLDDACAEWVYPQPPLANEKSEALNVPGANDIELGTLGLQHVETVGRTSQDYKRVHLAPNPCTIKINEVVIGVTSTDVLFDISSDETNANLEPGSRLARIAQHMLQQRSFYPLFPAAPNMNLNMKKMEQWTMPCRPDLLLLPSKLACFARSVLDSTVVVNPGHLTKGTTGGTFAIMDIRPMKREIMENAGGDDVELPHALHERTVVEIRRI